MYTVRRVQNEKNCLLQGCSYDHAFSSTSGVFFKLYNWHIGSVDRHKVCTHDDGASSCLAIDVLVPQVEDESGDAVKEGEDTDADEELGRRGEIALQKGFRCFTAVTRWQLVGVRKQPAGGDTQAGGVKTAVM